MTDFAAVFLNICDDICVISYCFAAKIVRIVKIYLGQHSSNFSDFENHHRAPD